MTDHREQSRHDKPLTEADQRFFALRESGYRGPIDHHGYAIPDGREAEYLRTICGGTS